MNAELYDRVWGYDAYRQVAPGEFHASKFLSLANPDSRVIDFESGTGRGAMRIARKVPILALDFSDKAMDAEVRKIEGIEFRRHDLRDPVGDHAKYGFCTDVLEHIAPEDVDTVLRNIFDAADNVFLAISTAKDHFGNVLVGEPLHLTVESPYWWHDKLTALGVNVGWSAYLHDQDCAVFYCRGGENVEFYIDANDVRAQGSLNIEQEQHIANIRANLERGLRELTPHEPQDTTIYLLAGGPSLNDFADQIKEGAVAGIPCVTVNGTYKWAMDHGIKPGAQFVTDGRAFNKRFVSPVIGDCHYFVSSQCDPSVLEATPKEQSWMWHCASKVTLDAVQEWLKENDDTRTVYPVYGGSTVTVCALVALAMLGYRKIEVFGLDSCFASKPIWRLQGADGEPITHGSLGYVLEYTTEEEATAIRHYMLNDYSIASTVVRVDKHHAYAQLENDADTPQEVLVGDKTFLAAPWMAIQADDIMRVIKYVLSKLEGFEMLIHGDGLVAAMLENAATPKGD